MKVKKGHHYPSWAIWHIPIIYYKSKYIFRKNIRFTKDSFFQFEGTDIYDYSKLFGISFGHHHKNESFRFGFRMTENNKIDISYYYYLNGKRMINDICKLDFNKDYVFQISFDKKYKKINMYIEDKSNNHIHNFNTAVINYKWWGYKLGLYVGGGQPSPKDIKIKIK